MATCIDVSSVAASRSRAPGSPGTPSGIIRAITTMTTPTSGAARRSGRGPPAPSRLSAGHVRVPNDASPAAANRAIGTGRSIAGSRRSTSSRTTTHAPRASRRRVRWTMVSSRPMPIAAVRSSGATDHASQRSWSTMPGSSGSSRRATDRNGPRPSSRPTRSHHGADTSSAITAIASSPSPGGLGPPGRAREQSKPQARPPCGWTSWARPTRTPALR